MNYSGIIFDLDGVLVRTDKFHYSAWKRVAEERGIYFDRIINKRLLGLGRMESLEIILEKAVSPLTQEQKEQMAYEKNEIYKQYISRLTASDVSAEDRETLIELRRRGVKLAVGSSSRNAKFILKQIGLTEYFDAISDGNNISHSKPSPEVFLCAATMLSVLPAKCLVVDDAMTGIDAAINGGMTAVAMAEAQAHPQATYKISSLSQLLDIVR
ncbi:MAG: beta-phosphoglucomutase [Clostridia bacterium]